MPINVPLIVCLAVALLLVVVALARELRLRRALQLLLARLLALWKFRSDQSRSSPSCRARSNAPNDGAPADDRTP